MGLFNGYMKPGPGVNKNAPKKKGLFLFLELLKRKFFNLMKIGMLHMLISIPMIAILFFLSYFIIMQTFSVLGGGASEQTILDTLTSVDQGSIVLQILRFGLVNVVLVLWGSGPASAGLAFILRCFTREKHAWLWSDFWEKFKENFKQAIIVSIIDLLVLVLALNAVLFYIGQYLATQSVIYMVLWCLSFFMLIIFTFMHFYIYQFMITFENKLRDIYRNALILALGKAPMNILLTAISVVITLLPYAFITPFVAFIISFVLTNVLARFVIEFYAARVIEKLIPKNENDEPKEESIFSDEIKYNEVEQQVPIKFE